MAEDGSLDFANRHQLTAASKISSHKTCRRIAWHSPDGKVHNQIDFTFISRIYATGVNRTRTRTFNKPDIGSDHDLVMMALEVRLKTNGKDKVSRTYFDLKKTARSCNSRTIPRRACWEICTAPTLRPRSRGAVR